MTKNPFVSVIMPAFNAEDYILQAIDSILAQTYSNFELIVVDDGSVDKTVQIVAGVEDPRLRLTTLSSNSGVAVARNEGLGAARGKYIAWLDADDISLPRRLDRQVGLLERYPGIGICGTWVRVIGGEHPPVWHYSRSPGIVRAQMLFDDPLATSSVMMRHAALPRGDGSFLPSLASAEDYDLWERVSRSWEVVNIPRVLTHYRIHKNQTSTRESVRQREAIMLIQQRQLALLEIEPTVDEWQVHLAVGVGWGAGLKATTLSAAESWLAKILEANYRTHAYPLSAMKSVIAQRRRIVRNAVQTTSARKAAQRWHTFIQ